MTTTCIKYLLITSLMFVFLATPTVAQDSIPRIPAYLETYNIKGLDQDDNPETVQLQILSNMAYLTTYGIENLMDDPIWRGRNDSPLMTISAETG